MVCYSCGQPVTAAPCPQRLGTARALLGRPRLCRQPAHVVRCSAENKQPAASVDRRTLLAGIGAVTAAGLLPQLPAEAAELTTFYGLATPPTSYGGFGGNAKEAAKYTFLYPENWKSESINKVQKGMQGVDSRVVNTRNKQQAAFVITFGRAGEDNKRFVLGDVEQTFMGFAGADYDMQDALTDATNKTSGKRDANGHTFYDYEIDSPDVHYLSTITVEQGKVYAMFIKVPSKLWKNDEPTMRKMLESFTIL